MGTGDCICISMTGGAPWGFRLQGGKEQQQPLQVAKIRSQSKASGSGLCEGDEVVSINGNLCADLTYPQVIRLMESVADSLHMLVRRPSGGVSDTENQTPAPLPAEGCAESATLHIRPAPEPRLAPRLAGNLEGGPAFSGSKKEEMGPRHPEAPPTPGPPRGRSAEEVVLLERKAEACWPGPVVELQLSLPPDIHTGPGAPAVAPLGAAEPASPDPDPDLHPGGTVPVNAAPTGEKGQAPLRSSRTFRIGRGPERGAGLPRVAVILACAAGQLAGGCGPPGAGRAESPLEGGPALAAAPPPLVAFAASSEGTEQGDDPRGEPDHSRPHKHRARHARLRRSESQSEQREREARRRCRRIAQLLTAAPGPPSRGALMFRKRRRRARRFTLVSYGTGAPRRPGEPGGPEEDPEDEAGDDAWDGAWEAAPSGASESDADEEPPADTDAEDSAPAVAFDWDAGLGALERQRSAGDRMELLPDTAGKGARMFARRRERMDLIAAQQEEDAARAGAQDGAPDGPGAEEAAGGAPSSVHRSLMELSPGPGLAPQHNGFGFGAETPRTAPGNRTARPFPGPAAALSPPRSLASPTAELPAPPPYAALTPPPAGPAPPPWPQPAPWLPERLASRDERIAVPAKRTGILQEARRRGPARPMFTFREPEVSPNPELLALLQGAEARRGGADSGPEEDHLSLGAEACNFLHGAAKLKTPPPVAPKPAARAAAAPASPVSLAAPAWAPGAAPARPPAFPGAPPPPGSAASSIATAPPLSPPARPASALSPAGPFRGAQAAVAGASPPASLPARPAELPAPAGGAPEPPAELPAGMQGRGAQLFARRQTRMERFVVDADTVQARAARAPSPSPSLPSGWKFSAQVRAPPPAAYNPLLSPSCPPAALRAPPPAQAGAARRKGKKPLNALEVMKHQPYQLSAALFTFQPPGAAAAPGPAPRQAPPARPLHASPASAPARGVPEGGRSLSLPGRPIPPTASATPAWACRPAHRHSASPDWRLTPWDAATEPPLDRLEDAFRPSDIRASVVASVVWAARRKVLPAPVGGWGDGLPRVPQAPTTSLGPCGRPGYHGAPLPNSSLPTLSQWLHASYRQPSRDDPQMMFLETRSEYCLSAAEGNYNPRPRGWRRPT
uniref:Synaptopodin-2 n=1 Tax=Pipistrellus kuhlii TaxID=59472 RepID=A0A7J7UAR1_PIPKU|nr:synaptopodin 2 [Pipistrellus kuhlii]